MTTKKIIVSERVNNEWRTLGSFEDRKTALNGIATKLNNDEDADPQNFKIEVVEDVNEEAVLMETAGRVVNEMAIFLKPLEIKKLMVDGSGFVELIQPGKYPSLSIVEVQKLFKVLDGVNAELPEGYEVFFSISHECAIRLFLHTPKEDK